MEDPGATTSWHDQTEIAATLVSASEPAAQSSTSPSRRSSRGEDISEIIPYYHTSSDISEHSSDHTQEGDCWEDWEDAPITTNPAQSHDDEYSPPDSLSSSQCSSPSLTHVSPPDSPLPERYTQVLDSVLNDRPTVHLSAENTFKNGVIQLMGRVEPLHHDYEIIDGLIEDIVYGQPISGWDFQLIELLGKNIAGNPSLAHTACDSLQFYLSSDSVRDQLIAVALWSLLLQHSRTLFISCTIHSGFLKSLEGIVLNKFTTPPVREFIIMVLGAAAFKSGSTRYGREVRATWGKVRPPWRPRQGMESWPDVSTLPPLDVPQEFSNPASALSVPTKTSEPESRGPLTGLGLSRSIQVVREDSEVSPINGEPHAVIRPEDNPDSSVAETTGYLDSDDDHLELG